LPDHGKDYGKGIIGRRREGDVEDGGGVNYCVYCLEGVDGWRGVSERSIGVRSRRGRDEREEGSEEGNFQNDSLQSEITG